MEANNAQAMREALENILKEVAKMEGLLCDKAIINRLVQIVALVRAALAAPPRNCDVGTAEEQAERYGRYCDKFTRDGMHCETCPCCGKIPFGKCEFAWAQMPYKANESEVR